MPWQSEPVDLNGCAGLLRAGALLLHFGAPLGVVFVYLLMYLNYSPCYIMLQYSDNGQDYVT